MISNKPVATGFFLLSILFFSYLITTVMHLSGTGAIGIAVPIGWIISVCLSVAVTRPHGYALKSATVCTLAIVAASIICAFMSDHSYDGNVYHQGGIAEIFNGWNPVHDARKADMWIWTMHYAKFFEVTQGAFLCVTRSLEATKVVNLIFYCSAAFLLAGTLKEVRPALTTRQIAIASILLLANPVCIMQVFTFYNDFAIYLETIILTCAITLRVFKSSGRLPWAIAFMITVIAINTKFTHFFYIGVEWAIALVWMITCTSRENKRRLILTSLAVSVSALIIGVAVTGYNPYVRNTIEHGSPFYPLVNAPDIDIFTSNTPQIYFSHNRFANFLISLTSTPGADSWQCAFLPSNFKTCLVDCSVDCRINGFGPLFIIMLAVTLIFAAFFIRKKWVWWTIGGIVLSTFVFEQCWWARYAPFVWAIPGIILIAAYMQRCRHTRIVAAICLTATTLQGSILVSKAIFMPISTHCYRELLFSKMQDTPVRTSVLLPQQRLIFDNANAKYIETPEEELDLTRCLTYYKKYNPNDPPTLIELSRADYDAIVSDHSIRAKLLFIKRHIVPATDGTDSK